MWKHVNRKHWKVVHDLPGKMMEESNVQTDESYEYDSFDENSYDRPKERWAPLGASAVTPPPSLGESSHISESEQLQKLEEEQEQLNSSLLALTTHFAQVQFRLKQIVSADPDDKENLLKELEEFAFKGIPDVRGSKVQDAQLLQELSDREHEIKINEQRQKQQELIEQLKSQLEDLETYQYETGGEELPTNMVMEKQKVVIDELKHKLNLDLDRFDKLSTEDLRQAVDQAIGQIVNPAKVKEKLVDQLKTQITDLERFIQFLQGEATSPGPLGVSRCHCPVHPKGELGGGDCCTGTANKPRVKGDKHESQSMPYRSQYEKMQHLRDTTLSIMKRALTILQIFTISQLGCGGREFQKNLLKRTTKGNHWGDLRAKLEVAVEKILDLSKQQEEPPLDSDYTSDSEDAPVIQCDQALTTAVRKDLAMALRDLMQHGLMEVGQSTSLVPFGCMPSRSRQATKMMHAWDLLIKYYEMKHGKEYNESPARKLSQSFDLEIVGGKAITTKQTLLGAIDTILKTHCPLKRSEDSMFKAFVCMGLNEKRLTTWLRLIFRTNHLIEFYYQPWSYVIKTGFDDGLRSLDRLNHANLVLPVDLAVRQFRNIKDAF